MTNMTDPPADPRREAMDREGWLVLAVFISVLSIAVAIVGVGFGMRAVDEAEGGPALAVATGEPVTFDIELGDLYVRPSSIDVPAGAEVIVNVHNAGAVVFNGYVNQYQHHPIRVEPNERVRVWVLDGVASSAARTSSTAMPSVAHASARVRWPRQQ